MVREDLREEREFVIRRAARIRAAARPVRQVPRRPTALEFVEARKQARLPMGAFGRGFRGGI